MWLFGDSFDHYTDLTLKYQAVGPSGQAISAGTGRYGTSSVRFSTINGLILKGVTPGSATAGAFCSMAQVFTPAGFGESNISIAGLWDGSTGRGHVVFVRNTDGSISAWRPDGDNSFPLLTESHATLLGTTPAGLFAFGVYASIELYAKVHASAGVIRIRVNGAEVLTLTGLNTKNSAGSTTWSGWYLGAYPTVAGNWDVDDLLIYDDYNNGDGVTNFLGDLTAECLLVTGPGASAEWTKNTGASNAAAVAENPPDGDTTYVADDTVGETDTYAHGALTRVTDGIACVQVVATAKKSGAGTRAIAGVIRRAGTDYPGDDHYLGTSYAMAIDARPLDPSTSAAWTAANVNAAEIGQQVTV